ncbi:hypothetical protein ACH42_09110 [Endozoicomonas sp. (ex Bugula neritina AB1)]|nr:hypothetical protein ACH42_09110 [Endozoicomonas sp. (ex Bugula neritina AB1)]
MNALKKITISSCLIDHALTGARLHQLDVLRLLRKSNITAQQLKEPDGRLPLEKVVKLLRYCNGIMNDEMNGLLPYPFRVGSFRMMALAAVHSKNLGQALQRCIDFYNLFANGFHYKLDVKKRHAELKMIRIPSQHILDNYAINCILAVIHRFTGWLGNDRIILNQVKLDFPPPTYFSEYQYMFYGAPVLFNQQQISINFDKSYLNHPVVQTEASIDSYIRWAPMDLYLPLDAGGPWTMDVRSRLKETFSKKLTMQSLNELAKELELNPQTLRRRLKREGSSFDVIKSQIRRDMAIHYLGKNQLSIERIAEACGYTEPSSFIRAFKTWTGFTPLQFRKGLDIELKPT